jgi:hypothetical protein
VHPAEKVPDRLAALQFLVAADDGPGHVVGEVAGEVTTSKKGVQVDRMVADVASTDIGTS